MFGLMPKAYRYAHTGLLVEVCFPEPGTPAGVWGAEPQRMFSEAAFEPIGSGDGRVQSRPLTHSLIYTTSIWGALYELTLCQVLP